MLTEAQQHVYRFLRDEFDAEWCGDFARLRQIPSTQVVKFLDYFKAQTDAEKQALAEDLAWTAMALFYPGQAQALHPYSSGRTAYLRYANTLPLMTSWRYLSTRLLRSFLAEEQREQRGLMPAVVMTRAAAIVPTNAGAIRKAVLARFQALFSAEAANLGGGDWRYSGQYEQVRLEVHVDYGGRGDQLRYWVMADDTSRNIQLRMYNFEALLGFPSQSGWNTIDASNLESSADLLAGFVRHCAELPARLPTSYTQTD